MKSFRQYILEETPTNNAGSGQIDGIGVGSKGEPGAKSSTVISRLMKRKKKEKK